MSKYCYLATGCPRSVVIRIEMKSGKSYFLYHHYFELGDILLCNQTFEALACQENGVGGSWGSGPICMADFAYHTKNRLLTMFW